MRVIFASIMLVLLNVTPAWAEITYWLPMVVQTDSSNTYTYNVKVPKYFADWVLKSTQAGGGTQVSKTIEGQSYSFIKQYFSWDTGSSYPAGTGQIRIDNKSVRHLSDAWMNNPSLKSESALIAALDSAVKTQDINNKWRSVDSQVLQWDGATPPSLTIVEDVPRDEQLRARLEDLAKHTSPGMYYADAQVPKKLAAFRMNMLELGNIGRRNPGFRKNNQYASDLSKKQAVTKEGLETIYKHNPVPPYFKDLVLNEKLNKACQFLAEYRAHLGRGAHDGPRNYKGKNLSTMGQRVTYFAKGQKTAGEGVGSGGPSTNPEGWMSNETHYRPWFNIGANVRSMGLGAAMDNQSRWWTCKLAGVSSIAKPDSPDDPFAPPLVLVTNEMLRNATNTPPLLYHGTWNWKHSNTSYVKVSVEANKNSVTYCYKHTMLTGAPEECWAREPILTTNAAGTSVIDFDIPGGHTQFEWTTLDQIKGRFWNKDTDKSHSPTVETVMNR